MFDPGRAFDVQVMVGIGAYLRHANRHTPVVVAHGHRLVDFRSSNADGIIANLDDPWVADAVVASGVKAVGFGTGAAALHESWGIPYLHTNNDLIAIQAAEHLLERGFDRLAYCGCSPRSDSSCSAERERAFVDHARRHGRAIDVFHTRPSAAGPSSGLQSMLCTWLRGLPRPVGIMAAHDWLGREVVEACRISGIGVPTDAAVIGVGNEELVCQLGVPLSSIDLGANQIGYAAATLLDKLIDGKPVARVGVAFSPIGVVPRVSTDVIAIADASVAKAMTFIREHADGPLRVSDVVRAVGISPTALEVRFRANLRHTVRDAIQRAHLDRARQLIGTTGLPLKQVAIDSGYKTVQHMTICFTRAYGLSPGRFRKVGAQGLQAQGSSGGPEGSPL